MMIVSIHQPEHFPWLGFFEKMQHADVFVLLDDVQFSKGDFQNRTRIKGRGGVQWLTVPIIHKFPQKINEVMVAPTNWPSKHRKSIQSCYARSRYFLDFAAAFDELYNQRWERLMDLNVAALELVVSVLGLKKNWIFSSSLELDGKKSDLILDICRKLGASVYYSGRTGSTYLKREEFQAAGIEIVVQNFIDPAYEGLFPKTTEGVNSLSVLDLLFNCGLQSRTFLTDSHSHSASPR